MGDKWAEFLLVIACVAQFFCGLASVTSASRMMFAFSRDRAIPGYQLWRQVSKKERVPVNSIWAICFMSWALMLPTLKNPIVGYAVGTSIAVIGLYIAFVLPIILRYRAKENFERGAWHLGNHYKWIDPLAIGWIVLICILFLLPLFPDGIPGNSAVVGSHFLTERQLDRRQLRTTHGRRRLHPLRRMVGALGQELVQGARPDGHRGRAGAHRGGLRLGRLSHTLGPGATPRPAPAARPSPS